MTPSTDTAPTKRRAFPIARVLAVMAALAIAGIWIWAFAAGSSDPPGLLQDDAFGPAATQICDAAATEVAALPPAYEAANPAERADAVEQSNVIYSRMLEQLSAVAPINEHDAPMTQEWLGDWKSYIADRVDYAQRLRSDQSSRFYVSTKEGNQVTNPLDRFAKINQMEACATPSDLS